MKNRPLHLSSAAAVLLTLPVLVLAWHCGVSASARAEPASALRGEKVAVEAELKDGRLIERYLAKSGGTWVEIATSGKGRTAGPISLVAADGTPLEAEVNGISVAGDTLTEVFSAAGHRIVRKLTIVGDGSWIRVVTRFEPSRQVALKRATDQYHFSHRADWTFSPSVGGFNPDAQYKAPLILVQKDGLALGIIPDVTALRREELKRCNHALDLDVPGGPLLSVGFIPARRIYHSVYGPDPDRTWTVGGAVENAYYLLVTASAAKNQAYRQAVRFLWERFGRAELAIAARQQAGTAPEYRSLALWDDWRKQVWERESVDKWLPVPLPDGSTGGGVLTRRWGPGPSVYLSSWFNTLRTSFGMALYARRSGHEKLLRMAEQTVVLALQAPGRDGAFKCIAVPVEDGKSAVWAAGDGCGPSTKDGFLGYDMCWTGYWLLRWRAAGLPGGAGILQRCRHLARSMIARQAADGMLPTRFNEDGSVDEKLSRRVKAETGPVVLFLLELYGQDRNPAYLAAAEKGLSFLDRKVIPLRQWYDYETFWSCACAE